MYSHGLAKVKQTALTIAARVSRWSSISGGTTPIVIRFVKVPCTVVLDVSSQDEVLLALASVCKVTSGPRKKWDVGPRHVIRIEKPCTAVFQGGGWVLCASYPHPVVMTAMSVNPTRGCVGV